MIGRPCLSCGAVIPASASRCDACQRSRWREAPSRETRGYSRAWQALARKRRKRHPICELRLPGCTVVAVDTDHRIPIRAGGRPTWRNAQSACRSCHRTKTAQDRERYPISV